MKCVTPFYKLDSKVGDYVAFPCGQCYECKMRRVNGWAFRLQQEFKHCNDAHFVTFTYTDVTVPMNKHGYLTLDKSDFQKFMKRLRKDYCGDFPIKYFACGEYGTHTDRPHYHAIIFNAPLNLIEKQWTKGHIHRGDVNAATIYYTLKYMMKSRAPKQWWKAPEFQLMSKGLGSAYLNDNSIDWHKADLEGRYYLPLEDGLKCPLPRYYKDKIYSESERQSIGLTIQHSLPPPVTNITKEDLVLNSDLRLKRTKFNNDKL